MNEEVDYQELHEQERQEFLLSVLEREVSIGEIEQILEQELKLADSKEERQAMYILVDAIRQFAIDGTLQVYDE